MALHKAVTLQHSDSVTAHMYNTLQQHSALPQMSTSLAQWIYSTTNSTNIIKFLSKLTDSKPGNQVRLSV